MLLLTDRTARRAYLQQKRVAILKKFCRDEDGSILIMALMLMITMLIVGGMSVDFMRFESRRALLQSVTDRAVLSAANLDNEGDGQVIIADFFEKAGHDGKIVGTPTVVKETGSSTVIVDSAIDVNTFYLRLVGIDYLTAPATSSAIQGTGKVEVSLVLDISGSMDNSVTVQEEVLDADGEPIRNADGSIRMQSVNRTKMELLQAAASDFVDQLLIEDFEDQISINLIAYSQQVALDDDLYKALRTTPDSISESGLIGSSFGSITDGYTTLPDDPDAPVDISWANGEDVFVNPSRCVDFEAADFNSTAFDVNQVYDQVEYFEHYRSGDSGIDFPVCPEEEFESILLLSQDADELKRRINLYRPTSYTSIHLGVKWGISLLDPALRPILENITSIDEEFRGNRPANYGTGDTVKFLVVMTDGNNYDGYRIEDDDYDSYNERVRWAEYPMQYWRNNIASPRPGIDSITDRPGSRVQFDNWMASLCDQAKANMTIYTIAMGADEAGADAIARCASQPAYAFETSVSNDPDEPGIGQIFSTIADRITALRLAL